MQLLGATLKNKEINFSLQDAEIMPRARITILESMLKSHVKNNK